MCGRHRLLDFCLVVLLATIRLSVANDDDKDENAVSRSYITKHSPAWKSFALANDIEKREKLKKALRDALNSVDSRKSEIITTSEDESTGRIKHAAMLLKEFQQIHKLSETVKRTLVTYEVAKSNLSKTINNDNGIGMLKRFLVGRSKRTFVPHAKDKYEDVRPMVRNLILDKPHYLKHTDRISVIATPLNKTGEVGVEFISVDPKTSSLARAKKAFRAAKILLKYVGNNNVRKDNRIDGLVDKLRKDIDGVYRDNDVSNEKKKKSLLANKASLFILKYYKPLKPTSRFRDIVSTKKRVIESDKIEEEKSVAGDTSHPNNEIQTSHNENKKNETSDSEKLNVEVKEERTGSRDSTGEVKDGRKQSDLLQSTLNQEETIQTLREAKLARQKYEIARHELAEKVKELYKMANQYEKDETDNQVLEVKNDHIPKANNNTNLEDNVNVPHTKRDDSHPGMALSGVSRHVIKEISTSDTGDNGIHKAFTMGAIDKKEHQVTVDEDKEKARETKLFPSVPSKHKAYDIGVPSNVKLDELKDEVGKNMKTEEQSLKVIAQAIKEDMKDIAKVNKKKKMIQEAVSENRGEIKGKKSNDNIDEYLTKALSDIMGDEAVAGSESGKQAEDKQKERTENNKNTNDENMKIVAEAMKSSANHDVQLPLVSSSGDKISLNKNGDNTGQTQQRDSKDNFQHVSDHKAPLDMNDPSNKALLDKAVHLEEQVAAQQDKLYSGHSTHIDTPGQPNVAVTPEQSKVTTTSTSTASSTSRSPSAPMEKGDAYGSIKETMDSPSERQRLTEDPHQEEEEEDDYDDDDEEDDDRHARRHHGHHPHYDDDDDYDDDDEEDDHDNKRGHVTRYNDEDAEKRSFKDKPSKPNVSRDESVNSHTATVHFDDLEDTKRSKVPRPSRVK